MPFFEDGFGQNQVNKKTHTYYDNYNQNSNQGKIHSS
jgi:hypothetical protein